MDTVMCEDCVAKTDGLSIPFEHMKVENDLWLSYNGQKFSKSNSHFETEFSAEHALMYAHMRVEKQQQEINVLKQELNQMKQTMSDFIAACELVPDGPMAQEIVERTQKMLKK
jgi:hypothetical protein